MFIIATALFSILSYSHVLIVKYRTSDKQKQMKDNELKIVTFKVLISACLLLQKLSTLIVFILQPVCGDQFFLDTCSRPA